MILPPEQLVIHARAYLGSPQHYLPYRLAVNLTTALEDALAEITRLRERIVQLEQERFE